MKDPSMTTTSVKKRILLVDDDPDVSYLFSMILKMNDFEVVPFTDPEAALAVFDKSRYDLLLLDVKMPKMSGFDLYRIAREKDRHARVCFMTNYRAEYLQEFRESFPDLSSDSLVDKPAFASDLLKILLAQLEK